MLGLRYAATRALGLGRGGGGSGGLLGLLGLGIGGLVEIGRPEAVGGKAFAVSGVKMSGTQAKATNVRLSRRSCMICSEEGGVSTAA